MNRYTLDNFYQSKAWRTLRNQVIMDRCNDDYMTTCERCGAVILNPRDIICHHITELTEQNVNDSEISLNPDNIQVVCHTCHNKIHERWQGGQKQKKVYIVYGAPCSGKTTYVKQHAGRNDLIIDMDNIYEMISVNRRYEKPDSLKNVAFKIRDECIDMCRRRFGRWETCWVVGGYPYRGEREALAKKLGAECVYISSTLDECMNRRKLSGREWIWDDYIRDWFDRCEVDES